MTSISRPSKIDRISRRSNSEPITILLVEDSRSVRAMLRGFINRLENIQVIEAETLAAATDLLKEDAKRFFCAVLDLTLPDASGAKIVDLVSAYGVPIIVLTGNIDPMAQKAMQERKVIDYMLKDGPASLEDVAYLIGRLRQNCETKILVVDDSASFRHYLTNLLTQYRFQVITAPNGKKALEVLAEHSDTSLVITDFHMPEMDGLELVRTIRKSHHRESLAIIALSDMSRQDLSVAMLKAGANDYLSKPFQLEEFYCRVVQNINMVGIIHELRDMANRDFLTRLYNRRYLFEIGEQRHKAAKEGKCKLALAIVDADHFKRINDRYGHSTGDIVLKAIADTMQRTISRSDIVSRYGGEEFICLALVNNAEDGFQQFNGLRQAIENLRIQADGITVPVTVSIGFTCQPEDSLLKMIEIADQALYKAKANGRNQVLEA